MTHKIQPLSEQEVAILQKAAETLPVYRRDLVPVPNHTPLETGCFKCTHVQGPLDPNKRYSTLRVKNTSGVGEEFSFVMSPTDRFWQGKTTAIRKLLAMKHPKNETYIYYIDPTSNAEQFTLYARIMWSSNFPNIKHKNQQVKLTELLPTTDTWIFSIYNIPQIKGIYLDPRRTMSEPISIQDFRAPTQAAIDAWTNEYTKNHPFSNGMAHNAHNLQTVKPLNIKKPSGNAKKKPGHTPADLNAMFIPANLNAAITTAQEFPTNPTWSYVSSSPEHNGF